MLFLETVGNAKTALKISMLYGDFNAYYTLIADDFFGFSVAGMSDMNGGGTNDLAVGAFDKDGGTTATGTVYVIFLETIGTVKDVQKLSMLYDNFNAFYTLHEGDQFCSALAAIGDVDGDGVVDLAVGSRGNDDGSSGAGAVYVLSLESDGTVKGAHKLSMLYGNFNSLYALEADDNFGTSI